MKKSDVPKEVAEVSKTLVEAGFEAYLVGGCVRDMLLGREPKDWDIATNAKPEEVQKLFEDTVYEKLLDLLRFCIRCDVPILRLDRKSTRLNSSHQIISYAVFCLKKKKRNT